MMLLGTFCGAIYGGSITAILINTPGTANSAATCLDGYPMATKLGQPGRALSISTMASTFGGLFSACALLFTAPLLSKIALNFGVPEMFALGVFGLSIVTAVSSHSIIKGLIGAILGLLLGTVGIDATSATMRFTFGTTYLIGGVQFVALLIGLFAFSQCLVTAEESMKEYKREKRKKLDQILPSKSDIKRTSPTILMCSIIGTIIGAIPGTGGDIASWIGYNESKRWSKHPEEFGTGCVEGIAAPEAGNNGDTSGALVPMLTLGVPGDATAAVLIGALTLQGLQPGPQLFTEHMDIVNRIFASTLVANFLFLVLGLLGVRLFIKVIQIKPYILTPIIFVLCILGSYALRNNMFDVGAMLLIAVIGYFFLKLEIPIAPIVLALILGPLAESNLRRSLLLSQGSASIFFTRPICIFFLLLAVLSLCWPLLRKVLSNRKKAA